MKFEANSVLGTPTVSIVVPNYNHAPYLEKRLDTIFNQTFQDFEVILLDDGSTDNSLEILKSHSDHPKVAHKMFEKRNSGLPFKQWQKGIQLAQGDYVWIAESDDWAELNFLEKLIPKLDDKTGVVFCKSYTYLESKKELNSYYFPEDLYPNLWSKNKRFDGQTLLKNYHANINTIPNASACLFRKDLAQFDDNLLEMEFCGDWLFWARLMKQTDVYFLAEKLNYWRSSQQTVRNRKGNQTEHDRFRECIRCLNCIREFSENERINLQDYDWLFLNYFSSKTIWSLPFQKKPGIPVSTLRYKMYLLRSSAYLLLKKIFSKK